MSDKIYMPCRIVKKEFQSGGSVLKFSFHYDKFVEAVRQHVNVNGYVNLQITQRKTVGQFGDTHCLSVDTWEPRKTEQAGFTSNPGSRYSPPNDHEPSKPIQVEPEIELPF
jgi:hypothetical protein